MATIKKAQNGATRQLGTDSFGRPHPIVEHIDRKPKAKPKPKPKVVPKPKSQAQIAAEKEYNLSLEKSIKNEKAYDENKEKFGTIRDAGTQWHAYKTPSGKYPIKEKPKRDPDKILEALSKDKNGGKVMKKKMKNGGSLTGLKASTKRDKGTDPKGAWTKVQKKAIAGAKGKASLTKDKQLGATKMAKRGMSIKKK